MKKLHFYSLNIFIIIALTIGNSFAQHGDPYGSGLGDPNGNDPVGPNDDGIEYMDPTQDPNYSFPLGPVNLNACPTIGVDQSYVLHLENETVLVLELLENPTSEVRVYDAANNIVASTYNKKAFFTLNANAQYQVKTNNACSQEGLVLNVSTVPTDSKSNIELPNRIFDALAENSNDENSLSVLDFLKENESLTATDKMFAIQQYYFDGSFTPSLTGGLLGLLGDSMTLDVQSGWDHLGDKVLQYVYAIPNRDCNCKVVYAATNNHTEFEVEHAAPPYKWFQHKVTTDNQSWGGNNRYYEWRNATKGAMKVYDAKQYMKGSHSNYQIEKFPDVAGAKSPYQTFLSYNMICEDSLGQKSGCMCVNRVLEVGASYKTSVNTTGAKVKCTLCGSGYKYYAQVEDWAVLTKSSKMTGIGVLDAGRVSGFSQGNGSRNPEWLHEVFNIATSIAVAAATKGTTIDSTMITNFSNSLYTLLTTSGGSGFNLGSNATGELLGGPTTSYSIALYPNDPTYVTIHSFYASELGGHTKWRSEASIRSTDFLVGYITDQLTPDCCNEETYNWIVGVNDVSEHYNVLKDVNDYLTSRGISAQRFPSQLNKEYTGSDESGFQIIPSCPVQSGSTVLKDTDILPIGTQYFVADLLFGIMITSGNTSNLMTVANLKAMVIANSSIPTGYYSLVIVVNGQTFNMSIYKP